MVALKNDIIIFTIAHKIKYRVEQTHTRLHHQIIIENTQDIAFLG